MIYPIDRDVHGIVKQHNSSGAFGIEERADSLAVLKESMRELESWPLLPSSCLCSVAFTRG
jgi:hypothetical protein